MVHYLGALRRPIFFARATIVVLTAPTTGGIRLGIRDLLVRWRRFKRFMVGKTRGANSAPHIFCLDRLKMYTRIHICNVEMLTV
jgi:hypothetical protein